MAVAARRAVAAVASVRPSLPWRRLNLSSERRSLPIFACRVRQTGRHDRPDKMPSPAVVSCTRAGSAYVVCLVGEQGGDAQIYAGPRGAGLPVPSHAMLLPITCNLPKSNTFPATTARPSARRRREGPEGEDGISRYCSRLTRESVGKVMR